MSSSNQLSVNQRHQICNHPRVGLGVFVVKDDKFLIGKRKGSHGSGTWQLPGGHLDFGESFEDCAKREVLEETNLKIKNVQYQAIINMPMLSDNLHYVAIFMRGEVIDKNSMPKNMEPDKCEAWEWVTWEDLTRGGPESKDNKYRPLFQPIILLLIEQNYYKPI
ncbi:22805_t:CDS:2 [Entrophospora sp. SA101]|nr:22805_t:CDS:2 [Entrophospora sp. SA101]CAJ0831761.1 4757_t:CDS:2 [Entrophospora sp. SA101]